VERAGRQADGGKSEARGGPPAAVPKAGGLPAREDARRAKGARGPGRGLAMPGGAAQLSRDDEKGLCRWLPAGLPLVVPLGWGRRRGSRRRGALCPRRRKDLSGPGHGPCLEGLFHSRPAFVPGRFFVVRPAARATRRFFPHGIFLANSGRRRRGKPSRAGRGEGGVLGGAEIFSYIFKDVAYRYTRFPLARILFYPTQKYPLAFPPGNRYIFHMIDCSFKQFSLRTAPSGYSGPGRAIPAVGPAGELPWVSRRRQGAQTPLPLFGAKSRGAARRGGHAVPAPAPA
jgi:hypothetical protein